MNAPARTLRGLPAGSIWFHWPLGDAMHQLNAFVFYALAQSLERSVSGLMDGQEATVWFYEASGSTRLLKELIEGAKVFALDESADAARELSDRLEVALVKARDPETADERLLHKWAIHILYEKFVHALTLELGRAPIFYVPPKGVYDTRRMIGNADAVFHQLDFPFPDEVIQDVRQSGRCLAFTLPTAAAFHIARATEAVIRLYVVSYDCPPLRKSERNWGRYIQALADAGAPERITHHLTQLKDLHRNPMVHPEVTLTDVEAESLWSICTSLIVSMCSEMKMREAERRRPNDGELL